MAGRPQKALLCKDFGFTVSKKGSHQKVLRRQMASVVKAFPGSVGQSKAFDPLIWARVVAVTMAVAMGVMRSWVLDTF